MKRIGLNEKEVLRTEVYGELYGKFIMHEFNQTRILIPVDVFYRLFEPSVSIGNWVLFREELKHI